MNSWVFCYEWIREFAVTFFICPISSGHSKRESIHIKDNKSQTECEVSHKEKPQHMQKKSDHWHLWPLKLNWFIFELKWMLHFNKFVKVCIMVTGSRVHPWELSQSYWMWEPQQWPQQVQRLHVSVFIWHWLSHKIDIVSTNHKEHLWEDWGSCQSTAIHLYNLEIKICSIYLYQKLNIQEPYVASGMISLCFYFQ